MRPAEVASPLAAHKNSRKAQIHVGSLSNWNRQNANALGSYWTGPTLPNGTREGWIGLSPFQRIGPARAVPPIRASGSPIRDRFKSTGSGISKICSSDPSIAWLLLQ